MTMENYPLEPSRPAGPSRIAEGIALQRMAESILPENVRIFNDPYAVRFIDPVKLAWARDHPVETRAMVQEIEMKMPGWSNSIRARVRYFDDVVQNAAAEGFCQLVILGAGYDTRAYRIGTLQDRVQIFEIDRPETQERKTGILKTIFRSLPDHVAFIPLDMAQENCWDVLQQAGFLPAVKTLFVLEGLVMYLPRVAVESLFAEIARHAGAGSAVLFDFIHASLADGSSDAEGGRAIRDFATAIGEPLLSGFSDGEVVPFLAGLGFESIQVIPPSAYAEMYYTGKNVERKVSGLLSFAYAKVPGGNRT